MTVHFASVVKYFFSTILMCRLKQSLPILYTKISWIDRVKWFYLMWSILEVLDYYKILQCLSIMFLLLYVLLFHWLQNATLYLNQNAIKYFVLKEFAICLRYSVMLRLVKTTKS